MNDRPFGELGELQALIGSFEDASVPKDEWDHRAHLTVALWLLHHHGYEEGAERMIQGIRRYNKANGILDRPGGGYHETITRFWLLLAWDYYWEHGVRSDDILEMVNGLVARYQERKQLVLDYYSEELLWSQEARQRWVAPDLQPHPGSTFVATGDHG